ncbi:TetR/AcrR family transcriptional regulator [Symbiobacterium thermophilum]|uniref:TetR/AcrR family transcriptional regulator n=1 Tax=Symbiobacterium thermophilum TaxID=2734 RepID=UPI000325790D|nr:TetR/AcrR family transcriptional regulator [Symbiobacterium thermophilum]
MVLRGRGERNEGRVGSAGRAGDARTAGDVAGGGAAGRIERRGRQSRRTERALRILDAAASLVERYGYSKTTMDDVAREAGVAKGTLYLHWNTREELFGAVLRREQILLTRSFLDRMRAQKQPLTVHALFKQAALGLLERPLVRAVFTRDVEVVGNLLRREQRDHPEQKELFHLLLDFLGRSNLMRRDLTPQAQAFLVSAIFLGFFLMVSWVPDQAEMSDEQVAGLMADTVVAALHLDGQATPREEAEAAEDVLRHLEELVAREEAAFQAELA